MAQPAAVVTGVSYTAGVGCTSCCVHVQWIHTVGDDRMDAVSSPPRLTPLPHPPLPLTPSCSSCTPSLLPPVTPSDPLCSLFLHPLSPHPSSLAPPPSPVRSRELLTRQGHGRPQGASHWEMVLPPAVCQGELRSRAACTLRSKWE